nr:receptor-type tyrosine-protein phosphatase H-like [Paramormyrops kingsleyae]
MESVPHIFRVTWLSSDQPSKSITTEANQVVLPDLRPGTEYKVTVCTVLEDSDQESDPACITFRTKLPQPQDLTIDNVTPDSVTLSWQIPVEMLGHPEQYMVTWDFKGMKKHLNVKDRNVTIENLSPGREYVFSVVTIGTDDSQSECAFARVCTEPSPPVSLKAEEVRSTSVTLCWQRPAGMEDLSYQYIVTYGCNGEQQKSVELESSADTVTLWDLKPGTEYSFIIGTVLQTGSRSREKSICVSTKPSTPQSLIVYSMDLTSVIVGWKKPSDVAGVPHKFRVTWLSTGQPSKSITTVENHAVLSDLRPGRKYKITVCTVLEDSELESDPACTTFCTKLPQPQDLTIDKVTPNSGTLSWQIPMEMLDQAELVTCDFKWLKKHLKMKDRSETTENLSPGRKHVFSVVTTGNDDSQSECAFARVCTGEKMCFAFQSSGFK